MSKYSKPNLTMGERFKDARIVHNQHGKETTGAVADATGVSKSTLSEIENDKRAPGAEIITVLARHYGVSADYLLGLSDVITSDITTQAIIEYTGLSEKNIKTLHGMAQHLDRPIILVADDKATNLDGNKPFLDCLNDLLEAVYSERENVMKHYIRMRRRTVRTSAVDVWYVKGTPTSLQGLEPQRYDDLREQLPHDNELVEYDCMKIAKAIERNLGLKYIATQEEIDFNGEIYSAFLQAFDD